MLFYLVFPKFPKHMPWIMGTTMKQVMNGGAQWICDMFYMFCLQDLEGESIKTSKLSWATQFFRYRWHGWHGSTSLFFLEHEEISMPFFFCMFENNCCQSGVTKPFNWFFVMEHGHNLLKLTSPGGCGWFFRCGPLGLKNDSTRYIFRHSQITGGTDIEILYC